MERELHGMPATRRIDMRARDLMTTPAITCHVNDSLDTVARKMWDEDIGAVAVVNDDGKLTGMVTDRDICMAAFTQCRPVDQLLVNIAMAGHVLAVGPEASISEVEALMANKRVRRLPVVDGERRPIGMVSLNDLAIECVQPDTHMTNGPTKIAHVLASICAHRNDRQRAA